ncbi:MAG: hypothetical protein ATN35_12860 [Epulopiscium sp. Nele67-Bin004]|nr:MAG: hypothetical protein ATN35_12860 [Epulopiscium sp. Nele67-Bin004]
MRVAIYSRKSKFTQTGDSIENQITLCKNYIEMHYPDAKFTIYEDEGFSGGNVNRPELKRFLEDAKQHKFDILACYRLDRISRNIADFSTLMQDLESYNVSFVSIKEQFDTTTPLGRAMMYIASVFAQLERETIAERIRDNMLQNAKTGRWLGGVTPTGFSSTEVAILSDDKERKYFKLTPIPEEIELVRLIYTQFLKIKTLSGLETHFLKESITTKNDCNFTKMSLRGILTNPVYAVADSQMYEYFVNNSYGVYANKSEFDGKCGLMSYNKTSQTTTSHQNDISDWIVTVGEHAGIISSADWIAVQQLLHNNSDKMQKKSHSNIALLSGVIRCIKCGGYMRPKTNRSPKDGGTPRFYYICELKEKSRGSKCDGKNGNGISIDKYVVDFMCRPAQSCLNTHEALSLISIQINNLVERLSLISDDDTAKVILDKIAQLKLEQQTLSIDNYDTPFYNLDFASQKQAIREVIYKVEVLENGEIQIYTKS